MASEFVETIPNVARRAQVFRGIKTKCRRIAEPTGLRPIPLRAPCLCGVFNQRQPALPPDLRKLRPVGALPIQMHWQNRLCSRTTLAVEYIFHCSRRQIERHWINVCQRCLCPARKIALTEAKS